MKKHTSGVLELGFLGEADELLDVIPLAFEKRGIIWYGVICGVGCGNTADDSDEGASRSIVSLKNDE